MGSYYSWRIEKFHQHGLYWTEDAEFESFASVQFCFLRRKATRSKLRDITNQKHVKSLLYVT
jgi:hypothetical protein